MPVQFEEDQPFQQTGLPPEKPKALVKFLMDEGVAWTPWAAKFELAIIAILCFAGAIAVFIYRAQIVNSEADVRFDITTNPMTNIIQRSE